MVFSFIKKYVKDTTGNNIIRGRQSMMKMSFVINLFTPLSTALTVIILILYLLQ